MDDQDAARLRERAQNLLRQAEPMVNEVPSLLHISEGKPPSASDRTGLDQMIDDLVGLEAQMNSPGSLIAPDDAVLWRVRTVLGSLYATRWFNAGWSLDDRREGIRLIRAARAAGYVNAGTDANTLLLLAAMLIPGNAVSVQLGTLSRLNALISLGKMVVGDGSVVNDLREMQEVLREVIAAHPDNPGYSSMKNFTATLDGLLALVGIVAGGAPVGSKQISDAADPMLEVAINPHAPLLKTFMAMAEETDATSPVASIDDTPDEFSDETAIQVETMAPGTIGPDELRALIERAEAKAAAGGEEGVQITPAAIMGRYARAMRTADFNEMDKALRVLGDALAGPASEDQAWLAHTLFPAMLAMTSLTHGNQQDGVKAAEQLQREWPTLFPAGLTPSQRNAADRLTVSRLMVDYMLRVSEAGHQDDEAAMESLIQDLAAVERHVDPAADYYFLIPTQLSLAKLNLGGRRDDLGLMREAIGHMRTAIDTAASAPVAIRSLLESYWTMMLTLEAILDRQPDRLTDAIARLRAAFPATPALYGEQAYAHLSIATALEAQNALRGLEADAAALTEVIDELELAKAALTDRSDQHIANDVLWHLARSCAARGDKARGDNGRAVDLTSQSLRVVSGDVLLQMGTEHGLRSAKAGAGRGLRAAGWALADGRVDAAIECLDAGRALVLQASAAAGTVPERLRNAKAFDLAELWEQSAAVVGPSSDQASTAVTGVDYLTVPSDLRRRTLETLRRHEGADSRSTAAPSLASLHEHLREAGIDALTYLLPEGPDSAGRAVMVLADGTTRDLVLDGLSASAREPFEKYLDTSQQRFTRLRGAAATTTTAETRDFNVPAYWEDALDALCTWAGCAVVDEVINALPTEPTPDEPARVVLIPCGTLGIVPWHAATLSRPPAAGQPDRPLRACDLLVVSYASSAGELLRSLARDRKRGNESYDTDPVIVVDPSRTLRYAGPEATAIRDAFLPDARLVGYVQDQPVQGPGTPEEVLALLTGRDGVAPASMLQITAHGTASTRPTTSRLFLADPNSPAPSDPADPADSAGSGADTAIGPQHLTVAGILDASRPDATGGTCSSLVVLDCCETDLSSRDHDEALTLTTAFVARGAIDVVGSRWSIDDWAAAVCIVAFHHFLATRHLAPADALRAAQRWMLGPAAERDREPIKVLTDGLLATSRQYLEDVSSWGAFIHQGNPRP